MRALPALSVLALTLLSGTAPAAGRGCATAWEMQRRSGLSDFKAARASAVSGLSGRTYLTPHFAIHYTVARNVHQSRWSAADSALKNRRDAILDSLPSGDANRRDSILHALLDAQGAPHPAYIVQTGAYFENAYAYYKDSLGMAMPDSNSSSVFALSSHGRFGVEVTDLEKAAGVSGAYFGLTYPRANPAVSATIFLENDFLYNAVVNGGGTVSGSPVTSTWSGGLIHNYNVDWNEGLAVTIAHEFYHAVQFEYTPNPSSYHAWYELGAVAMEERLAPTVNDYLQYLRHVIPHTSEVSLLTGPSDPNYGNSIFHIFLSKKLGPAFDVPIWEFLHANNNLPAALLNMAGSQARWDSLYTEYAAGVAISGLPGAGASPLAFSPDMALWPKPVFDSALAKTMSQATLSPLTFRLVRPTGTGLTWVSNPGSRGAWHVRQADSVYTGAYIPDSIAPLASGSDAFAITATNSSFTTSRVLKLYRAPAALAAFPNPATRTLPVRFSARAGAPPTPLTVLSESGRVVATLPASSSGAYWSWNFRDAQDQPLPSGLYYFRAPGEKPGTLLVLP